MPSLSEEPISIPGQLVDGTEITSSQPLVHIFHAVGLYSFPEMLAQMQMSLLKTTPINRASWQTLDVANSSAHDTYELTNVQVIYDVPDYDWVLSDQVKPDLPWAKEHFLERVSGEPLNPAPSYQRWPHHNGTQDRHVHEGAFSHTYPERYWPKFANVGQTRPNGRQVFVPHNGIRYAYGDLNDVVGQLCNNRYTRQAVLPMWFPEDTGATDRRVPCSIAYHFMADSSDQLHVWYYMRACDFTRHLKNDIFFTARLLQWMCGRTDLQPGRLNATISSLHLFRGDAEKLPK